VLLRRLLPFVRPRIERVEPSGSAICSTIRECDFGVETASSHLLEISLIAAVEWDDPFHVDCAIKNNEDVAIAPQKPLHNIAGNQLPQHPDCAKAQEAL
jgi:hypothetical protein